MGTTDPPVYADNAKAIALSYFKKALAVETEKENKAKLIYMVALLGDYNMKKELAREYSQYRDTEFYRKRNCLILQDMAQ
jgi:hypothetical protein